MKKYKITIKGTVQLNGPRPINSSFITDDMYLAQSFTGSKRHEVVEAWAKNNYPGVSIPKKSLGASVEIIEENEAKKTKNGPSENRMGKTSFFSNFFSKDREVESPLASRREKNSFPESPSELHFGDSERDEDLLKYSQNGISKKKKSAEISVDKQLDLLGAIPEQQQADDLGHPKWHQLRQTAASGISDLKYDIKKACSIISNGTTEYYETGARHIVNASQNAKKQFLNLNGALVEFKMGV